MYLLWIKDKSILLLSHAMYGQYIYIDDHKRILVIDSDYIDTCLTEWLGPTVKD